MKPDNCDEIELITGKRNLELGVKPDSGRKRVDFLGNYDCLKSENHCGIVIA